MSKVNGKGKVGQSNSNPKKVDSNIALVSDPNEAICFYSQLKGHWKCSYPKYLEDIKKNNAKGTNTSCIFMIKLHSASKFDSWILDTEYGTHIFFDV